MDRKTLEEKLDNIRSQKAKLEADAQAAYQRLIGAENAINELIANLSEGEPAPPKED